jgi:hypothetical protein
MQYHNINAFGQNYGGSGAGTLGANQLLDSIRGKLVGAVTELGIEIFPLMQKSIRSCLELDL